MMKNFKHEDGHIVVEIPLANELPTITVEMKNKGTIYRFNGMFKGHVSLLAKVLRLMGKGEKL